MTRDPYQGSIWDPASLHRYNYARANPVNYIDPSGRSNLMEYSLSLSTKVAEAAALYLDGRAINCLYLSEASMVDLIAKAPWASQEQMEMLSANLDPSKCMAQITFTELAKGTLLNLAFGYAAEEIGWLLEDGAEGLPSICGPGEACERLPQWLRNFQNGRAFEQEGIKYLETVNTDIADQVSIRPFVNASGDLADYRVRVDAMSIDADGNLQLTDFKASDTAGFTPNQQTGYPLLQQFGGQVVGGNGGPFYPAGFVFPPTQVTIITPANLP
jgi:hypothetical protein